MIHEDRRRQVAEGVKMGSNIMQPLRTRQRMHRIVPAAVCLAIVVIARSTCGQGDSTSDSTGDSTGDSVVTASDSLSSQLLAAKAFRAAAAKVARSIVTIETFGGVSSGARRGRVQGLSRPGVGPTTGLIISSDGYVITSTFNFVRRPPVITVVLPDGTRHAARMLGRDESRRICLLKIDEVSGLQVPEFVDSHDLRVGQWAISVGVGYGDFEPAISAGIVSALNRAFGRAVQTDANTSPANYGGPLLDIEGNVIGICVPLNPHSTSQTAGVEWYDSGIGFAIPFVGNDAVLKSMKAGKTLHRGGLSVKLRQEGDKILVEDLSTGSSASKAGLKKGDRIIAVNGVRLREPRDVARIVGPHLAGHVVKVNIEREEERLVIDIPLDALK